jgi:hypothetical protein
MLWDIRARMKPALSVIEMIPHVHRTPALATLRKAALDGRCASLRLTAEEKELAFYDGPVQLISPIGARLLRALYREGRIKLKKPAPARLEALDRYIETEAQFRRDVAEIEAQEAARRQRLGEIVKDPSCAAPDEITPYLIDKVASAQLGHNVFGSVQIAGLTCYRSPAQAPHTGQTQPEAKVLCWWIDLDGNRQGDPEAS